MAGLGAIAPVLGAAGLAGLLLLLLLWLLLLLLLILAGTAGVAGMGLMMAMEECSVPLCVAASGQCCFLALGTRGLVCPDSC